MLQYLSRRVLFMIPTLFAISVVSFILIQLPPGDFLTTYAANLSAQPDRSSRSFADIAKKVQPAIVSIDTKDGESIGGIIRNETATTVTLRQPGGAERTVSRADIAAMKTSSQSFMPEGLESGLSAQDVADLIAFLFESRL